MRDLWSIFCPLSPSDWFQDPDETIRSITLQLLGFQALQTLASAWIKFWSRVWNTGSSISVLFFIADQLRHTKYVLRHTVGRNCHGRVTPGTKNSLPHGEISIKVCVHTSMCTRNGLTTSSNVGNWFLCLAWLSHLKLSKTHVPA